MMIQHNEEREKEKQCREESVLLAATELHKGYGEVQNLTKWVLRRAPSEVGMERGNGDLGYVGKDL